MNLDRIRGRKAGVIGDEKRFRSAVCIALVDRGDGDHDVLFEVRSTEIPAQPGDICLPGGAIEPGESPEEAALRETAEELLIEPEQIEMLGPSDVFRAGSVVSYPFVALISGYEGTFSSREVAAVFRVPLSFFAKNEPEAYHIAYEPKFGEDFPFDRIHGGKNYGWRRAEQTTLFYQCGSHTIWGLTAEVMHSFVGILKSGS